MHAFLSVRILIVIGILVAAVLLLISSRRPPSVPSPTTSATDEAAIPESVPVAASRPSKSETAEPSVNRQPTQKIISNDAGAATVSAEASPESRQLVQALSRGVTTPENIAQWKDNFRTLVQQGSGSIPAIREFLKTDVDMDFGSDGQKSLGYASARKAMFAALAKIGGDDAVGLIRETLQSTAEPREVAVLARTLEEMAPGQHTHEALMATRETLELAATGKLNEFDVAPLFEVMQKMGGPEVVQELESAAKKWNYYSAISLAQLPDGAGLPSLIQMSQDPKNGGSKNLAQQMLAQMSIQYPDARQALLDQARAGQIPSSTWPYLSRLLAGTQYSVRDAVFDQPPDPLKTPGVSTIHLASGNQNLQLTPTDSGATPDQVESQLAFVDQLAAATRDPAAAKAIEEARRLLQTPGRSSGTQK